MRAKRFYLYSLILFLNIILIFAACEKKREYAECLPICNNYDTIREYISAKLNGKLVESNNTVLYKINSNEVIDNCLFNIVGEIGVDSTLNIIFKADTLLKSFEMFNNVEYYNIGSVIFQNKDNKNLTKQYSTSIFSSGKGILNGNIILTSYSNCRMTGSFNFIGIDTKISDTINVTDGKFSVRMF